LKTLPGGQGGPAGPCRRHRSACTHDEAAGEGSAAAVAIHAHLVEGDITQVVHESGSPLLHCDAS
jgi:hypothetical protein